MKVFKLIPKISEDEMINIIRMEEGVFSQRQFKMKDLKVSELLELLDNHYDYFDRQPFSGYSKKEVLDKKLKECSVLLGIEGKTPFGFVFEHSQEWGYTVSVNLPSCKVDWEIALLFMQDISDLLNLKILDIDVGKEYTSDNILDYNFLKDNSLGLEYMFRFFQENKSYRNITFYGTYINIDREDIKDILSNPTPFKYFDELIFSRAFHKGERLKENFELTELKTGEEKLYTYYNVPLGKDFIIKENPYINSVNNVFIEKYKNPYPCFMDFQINGDGSEPCRLEYYFVINNLDDNKIEKFGVDDIMVKALDKDVYTLAFKQQAKSKYISDEKKRYIASKKKVTYDNSNWHYYKIVKNEFPMSALTATNHMADLLRFTIEKDLVSNFFKKYYKRVVDDVLNGNKKIDLRIFIQSTLFGELNRYLFNENGQSFLDMYYVFGKDGLSYPSDVDKCIKEYLGSEEYERDVYKNETYLFAPYNEDYYQFKKKRYLEKAYLFFFTVN